MARCSVALALGLAAIAAARADEVLVERNLEARMRDGVVLRANATSAGVRRADFPAAPVRLLAMTGPDPQDLTDTAVIGRTLIDCLTNPTLDPRLGNTESLIASGNPHLIRDKQLQNVLTEWPAAAQNVIRWQDIERVHGGELIVPFTFDYVAWPDIDAALGFSQEPSRSSPRCSGLIQPTGRISGAGRSG